MHIISQGAEGVSYPDYYFYENEMTTYISILFIVLI